MTQKAIGPTFTNELKAAGITDLRFSWLADGTITFDPACTSIAAVEAVYTAHDPTKVDADAVLAAKLQPTDQYMARVCEDLLVTLVTKSVIAKTDLPAAVVVHINNRRALRGQTAI